MVNLSLLKEQLETEVQIMIVLQISFLLIFKRIIKTAEFNDKTQSSYLNESSTSNLVEILENESGLQAESCMQEEIPKIEILHAIDAETETKMVQCDQKNCEKINQSKKVAFEKSDEAVIVKDDGDFEILDEKKLKESIFINMNTVLNQDQNSKEDSILSDESRSIQKNIIGNEKR